MTTEDAQIAVQRTRNPVASEAAEVASDLGVEPEHGLTAADAVARLTTYGPNRLSEGKQEPGWRAFLRQYEDFMQWVLLAAAVVNQLVTGETGTTTVLAGLTVFNAVIGLRQESKAEESVKALSQMMKTIARVRRGGVAVEIDAGDLVPGDIVLVEAGNRIPADGRVILAATLEIEEAALTGESLPVGKSTDPVLGDEVPLGDRTCMAYMNTAVTRGRGEMIVTATGMETEIGHIADMLANTETSKTPLQKQLDSLSKIIASIAAVALVIVVLLGLARGESFDTLFVTGVALAVAAIPTGLPAVVTALLSMGTREIARRNAIVKRLPAVETLGSTSAICSDKTGTLTLNKMTARELVIPGQHRFTVTGEGYSTAGEINHVGGQRHDLDPYLLPMVLCADAVLDGEALIGDPTEGALIVLGAKGGLDITETRAAIPRVAEVPFDSDYKFMATFHEMTADDGSPVVRCYVKGAPDVLIARATTIRHPDGRLLPITDDNRHLASEVNDQIANAGERVMVVAQRDLEPGVVEAGGDLIDHVTDLTLLAMVGIVDPPRPEARTAIAECHDAGIRVRMITGDHATTAAAIATELGIEGRAITGAQFAAMPDERLIAELDEIGVIARVAPEDKVRLVRLLKEKGNVVAMTGDGVNDAPALKTADIGVAMGITGTEVSKEAAVMILTDDNFATIVGAVSYGRTLYDNLLKYLRFQMSTLVAYIAIFIGAGIIGIASGTPLNPLQILWLNMVVDIPLAIALGFDQPARGLMSRPPRPIGAPVLSRNNWIRLCIQGAVMTVGALVAYQIGDAPRRRHRRRHHAADHSVDLPPLRRAAQSRPDRDDLQPGHLPRHRAAAPLRHRDHRDHRDHHTRLPAADLRHYRPLLQPVGHLHRHRCLDHRRRRGHQALHPPQRRWHSSSADRHHHSHLIGEKSHVVQPSSPQLPQGARLHPRRAQVPAQAVRRSQGREVRRLRAASARRQGHRDDLREDLDPDTHRVRGGGQGPGRPCDLPRAQRVPDRPQGVDEGHRQGARPDLRRHRVPRFGAGERGDAGGVRRSAGVERTDRRVPPDPDPRRRPDDDRAQRQAPERDRLHLPRRRPQQHGQLADGRRLQVRHGRPALRPAGPVARDRAGRDLPRDRRGDRGPAHPHRGRRRGRLGCRLPLHRRLGLDGRGRRVSGRSGSSCSRRTR